MGCLPLPLTQSVVLQAWEKAEAKIPTVDIVNYASRDFLCTSQAFLSFYSPSTQEYII